MKKYIKKLPPTALFGMSLAIHLFIAPMLISSKNNVLVFVGMGLTFTGIWFLLIGIKKLKKEYDL